MLRHLRLTVALTLPWVAGVAILPPVQAQAPSVSRPAIRATGGDVDLLKPYASRSMAGFVDEQSSRPYSRSKPLPPPARAYAAATQRGVTNYFPGMRPGSAPNKNVVDPHTLCVPNRRAAILRGR
jgi:hypothetical protein